MFYVFHGLCFVCSCLFLKNKILGEKKGGHTKDLVWAISHKWYVQSQSTNILKLHFNLFNKNKLHLFKLFCLLLMCLGMQDVDDFFEHERTFLVEYHNRVKDSSLKSDKMTRSHKKNCLLYLLFIYRFFLKVSELFDKTRKVEARVSADEDLKLSDLLKYYLRESQAAKDLLYRRSRSLVDYENANKALDKARAKNKDVLQAENTQQLCCHKFEKISESAKQELIDFKTRRVAAFRKNLVELAELELKHAKVIVSFLL
uniref:Sorting nexin 6 n=1 Tax=Laticauda laticaudata TaxID=8630 RepID=A0A8C5SHC6_LATLA